MKAGSPTTNSGRRVAGDTFISPRRLRQASTSALSGPCGLGGLVDALGLADG
jgi:hypothetical protein